MVEKIKALLDQYERDGNYTKFRFEVLSLMNSIDGITSPGALDSPVYPSDGLSAKWAEGGGWIITK